MKALVLNNIFYLISINLISICQTNNYRIGSKCGFPGLPHDTNIEPEKHVYEDGEEVSYKCPHDGIYLKTQVKKCMAGVWYGHRSTCGYFLRNQLAYVKIVDYNTNQVVYESITRNYSSPKYPTSYYDDKGTFVTVPNAQTQYKWFFNFSNPLLFDFFLLNLRIPASNQELGNQIDAIRVKNVEIINEPNRVCSLDFSTRDRSAKIFWFWCSVNNNTNSSEPISISFITSAVKPIDIIGLYQVYITKLQYCGQPALPLLTKYVPDNNGKEQVMCDPMVAIDTEFINMNKSEESNPLEPEDGNHYMSCVDDQYWAGNPKCLPKLFCDLDLNDLDVEIVSVQNAYIFNETKWYAIDGTSVEYKCKNALMTTHKKICINQTWDQIASVCHAMDSEANKNIFVLLTVAIIVIIILVTTILVIIKRRQSNSENFDGLEGGVSYDDVNCVGDTYEDPNYSCSYESGNQYETTFDFSPKVQFRNLDNIEAQNVDNKYLSMRSD